MNISVCMATYNGEQYVVEQIASILEQLSSADEVIVVDDCSTDDTVNTLKSLNDPRIKLYSNDRNRSHVYSFGRAISLAQNEIIFLSDQDDRWIKGRVTLMVKSLLDTGAMVVSTNSYFMDKDGNKITFKVDGVRSSSSFKNFKNIIDIFIGKVNYFGCAMAFRKRIVGLVLPMPTFVESHDLWIAMASNLIGLNIHLDDHTLFRRVHGNNASIIKRDLLPKIWSRVIFLASIAVLLYRIPPKYLSSSMNEQD